MKWFGPSWGALVCRNFEHVETPTGTVCPLCERPIEWHDQGLVVPHFGTPGDPPEHAFHKLCFLDSIIPPP